MDDLTRRLDAASKRREALVSECRKLEGKLEAAEAALKAIEDECHAKGIDPDKLDELIQRLTVKYNDLVTQVERDVATAEAALTPFTKEFSA